MKNNSENGKIFKNAIDKAMQWVYNDTVMLDLRRKQYIFYCEVYDGNCEKEEY